MGIVGVGPGGPARSGDTQVLDAVQMPGRYQVHVDRSRDVLLTDFGRATLADRYLMPGEEFQDLFARVASYYGDDHGACPAAVRLYEQAVVHAGDAGAVERRHPARPADLLLPERGVATAWTASSGCGTRMSGWPSKGGGIGSLLGQSALDRREGRRGTARPRGVIPFIRVMDSLTLAICQGSLRRGSAAVYLPVCASGDRGVHRNPPPDRRRSEPQGAEPASRHPGVRRVHARGGGRTRPGRCVRRRTARWCARFRRARCGSAS